MVHLFSFKLIPICWKWRLNASKFSVNSLLHFPVHNIELTAKASASLERTFIILVNKQHGNFAFYFYFLCDFLNCMWMCRFRWLKCYVLIFGRCRVFSLLLLNGVPAGAPHLTLIYSNRVSKLLKPFVIFFLGIGPLSLVWPFLRVLVESDCVEKGERRVTDHEGLGINRPCPSSPSWTRIGIEPIRKEGLIWSEIMTQGTAVLELDTRILIGR
jgi:hypothetical protein